MSKNQLTTWINVKGSILHLNQLEEKFNWTQRECNVVLVFTISMIHMKLGDNQIYPQNSCWFKKPAKMTKSHHNTVEI